MYFVPRGPWPVTQQSQGLLTSEDEVGRTKRKSYRLFLVWISVFLKESYTGHLLVKMAARGFVAGLGVSCRAVDHSRPLFVLIW